MFSWITGPRIANVGEEDLQSDPMDASYLEPPETPAPVFVVRAFKHALFGTPHPDEAEEVTSTKSREIDASNGFVSKETHIQSRAIEVSEEADRVPLSSPTKPNGILMTPGTGARGRKTVSFGAHVVDNEGKKVTAPRKSGLPNDCPGKYPSPWTPTSQLVTEKKPRTKLTAALYDVRDSALPKSDSKPKAKDDNDITIDMMEPRSESGKYWKEQYQSYAERSEKEMKKLVTKQQMAKNYAKKKDAEAMELQTKLADERKRHKLREKELEEQTKDYQEHLRQSMAENCKASMEIAAMRQRIATLEASLNNSEMQGKSLVKIYEDVEQEQVNQNALPLPSTVLAKPVLPTRKAYADKENSPSRPRRTRGATAPDPSHLSAQFSQLQSWSKKSSLTARENVASKENMPPSPDLWVQDFPSSPVQMDRLALPLSSAPLQPSKGPHINSKSRFSTSSKALNYRSEKPSGEELKKSISSDRKEAAKQRLLRRKGEGNDMSA
ncbi:hypothetical protein K432DRAFT_424674 [Lepidopterella palustris CBS 459.81]|uniref:Spindle pole body-associated protein cut12 domain-containing protein n=1 Tax=Lepidopterella palustris CBS 459.81 TaxID=1314670 RepID=A0A8E2JGM1_9PEZI|nr:hypothetical protein K432DRAFT_424674 [Lepidopterella palustris CBS 459.81]